MMNYWPMLYNSFYTTVIHFYRLLPLARSKSTLLPEPIWESVFSIVCIVIIFVRKWIYCKYDLICVSKVYWRTVSMIWPRICGVQHSSGIRYRALIIIYAVELYMSGVGFGKRKVEHMYTCKKEGRTRKATTDRRRCTFTIQNSMNITLRLIARSGISLNKLLFHVVLSYRL